MVEGKKLMHLTQITLKFQTKELKEYWRMKKMKMNDFFNEAFESEEELKKEYELLETKYKLSEELISFRKKIIFHRKNLQKKLG